MLGGIIHRANGRPVVVTFEIVLLAMVAAFLGLRLYSVLGKRTGHEQDPLPRQTVEVGSVGYRKPVGSTAEPAYGDAQAAKPGFADASAMGGMRSIANADRQFDAQLFIEGAKSAYKLILEAFWRGDKEALRFLCDDDVYESFAEEIDARNSRGETLENRLVRIEEAQIVDASYDHPMARISVRFDADIAALVKNADGAIVGGSLTDAVETKDIWTFFRDVKSNNRNWKLDETDAV